MESPAQKVLELVVFKLAKGATPEQLLETADAVSAWAAEQPGFISRELAYDEEGDRWIDVVWWQTMESAQAAAELAMTSESCAPMFALIDMESTMMLHGDTVAAA
jgi:antibiotic biosynthesis monooxygenase (ABM) superfamily enzyme